jgi:hypothetical protein
MPHIPGHGPSFEFPRPWQMASQAIPGFMSPETYGQIGRGLLDYVPGVSTALNWNEMGPWGRAGSVSLDALDFLTAGSGKPVTASLRGLSKLSQSNFFGPTLDFVRGGLPPMGEFGNYIPSTNWHTMQTEPGVSVYQAAKMPWPSKTRVFRNAPDVDVRHQYPSDVPAIDPDDVFFEPVFTDTVAQVPSPASHYTINPLGGQESVLKKRASDMYRILGNVMPGAAGHDLEAMLNPATMGGKTGIYRGGQFYGGVEQIPYHQFQRLRQSGTAPLHSAPTGLGSSTGLPVASMHDTAVALKLFAKYNPQGERILINPFEKFLDQASKVNLASTIPATVPMRGVNYTWDTPGLFGAVAPQRPYQTPFNLEENYQQQAANRGGWSPGG